MYMNLHTLPVGQAMFTAYVGDGGDWADEIDFVAPSRASLDTLLFLVGTSPDADGYEDLSIIGLIDQSAGYILFG